MLAVAFVHIKHVVIVKHWDCKINETLWGDPGQMPWLLYKYVGVLLTKVSHTFSGNSSISSSVPICIEGKFLLYDSTIALKYDVLLEELVSYWTTSKRIPGTRMTWKAVVLLIHSSVFTLYGKPKCCTEHVERDRIQNGVSQTSSTCLRIRQMVIVVSGCLVSMA